MNIERMTKQDKERLLDHLVQELIGLSEDEDNVLLLGKYNTAYVSGNKYTIKIQRED